MPTIQVFSDVHFEFHEDAGAAFVAALDPKGVDVLVVAGDLSNAAGLEKALAKVCARYPRVVFVSGNHEAYGAAPKDVVQIRERVSARHANLHWLEREIVEIGGVRFIGTTLWFPRPNDVLGLKHRLNDYSQILGFEPWVYEQNCLAVEFLQHHLREGDVVVTHHLPSFRSVHPKYAGSPLNFGFVCDVEDLIVEREPKLWFHGHSHESVDYRIGRTRVVCNPFGYAGYETNYKFKEKLLVEVSR